MSAHALYAAAVLLVDEHVHDVAADSLRSGEAGEPRGELVPYFNPHVLVHADNRRVRHRCEAHELLLLPLDVRGIAADALHPDDVSMLVGFLATSSAGW